MPETAAATDRSLTRRVVAFGFLATFVSSFGQTFFIGLFGPHFEAAAHVSNAKLGLFYGGATLLSGSLLFWLGGAFDRIPLRRALLLSSAIFTAGCMLAAGLTVPVELLAAFFLLRLGGQGLMSHLGVVLAARGGGQRKAGSIAGASMGVILGEAALPALVLAVMARVDWRWIWWAAAALLAVAVLPTLWRLGRNAPWQAGTDDGAAVAIDRRRVLLRQPTFWAGLALLLAPPFMITGFLFDQSVFSHQMNWSSGQVGAAFTAFAACRAAATWLYGRASDRFGAIRMARLHLVPMALGFAALTVPLGGASIWIAFAGLGFSAGANSVLGGAVWIDLFGQASLGLVRGVYVACMVAATALAPMVTAGLLSAGAAAATVGAGFAGYCVLASLLAGPALQRGHARGLTTPN